MLCAYFIIILITNDMFIKYLLKYIFVNKNCRFICRRNIDQIKFTLRDFSELSTILHNFT